MKLILTPEDQAKAISDFIVNNYGLVMQVSSDELSLIELPVIPITETIKNIRAEMSNPYAHTCNTTETTKAEITEKAISNLGKVVEGLGKALEEDARVEQEYEEDLDAQSDYRDKVIKEAESLGIKFRSDIKTETLEERIEEHCQEREALFTEATELGLNIDSMTLKSNSEIQTYINERIEANSEDVEELEEEEEDVAVPVPEEPVKKRSIFGN